MPFKRTLQSVWSRKLYSSKVGCRGVALLGGPDTWYKWGGPAKAGAHKLFLLKESSLVFKIKNN